MKDRLSTTSVTAIIESWRQQALPKSPSERSQKRVEVRTLFNSEKAFWKSQFSGDVQVPWFAAVYGEVVLAISDSLPLLVKELRWAGYTVYDLSEIA
ncbi:hypothetical protein K2P47_04685 [Patescibacteria group bacterium]|nr:hypothetical protein [Patescibacteria group bacterium]